LKEPFNDVSELLTDILNNNYVLLGKIVNSELSETEIKSASKELINKNKFVSQCIGQVSLNIFGAIVKDRPNGSSKDKQYSKLTKKERSEEHTSELQSRENLVCRLLLEKKKENEPDSLCLVCALE